MCGLGNFHPRGGLIQGVDKDKAAVVIQGQARGHAIRIARQSEVQARKKDMEAQPTSVQPREERKRKV